MKAQMKTTAAGIAIAAALMTSTARAADLPADWYRLPEDRALMAAERASGASAADATRVQNGLGKTFDANSEALEKMPAAPASRAPDDRPKDWMPWHLEYFTTDLAVTAQGLLGVMTIKGTPAVQAFWRRQGVKPPLPTESPGVRLVALEGPGEGTPADAEPVIRAALASGKIRDEAAFRENVERLNSQLQALAESLDGSRGSAWWVSGFRIDFSVEASGKISFVTVGADLRLRFEWKRLMRATPASPAAVATLRDPALAPIASGLRTLAGTLREDLERAAEDEKLTAAGFKAYSFRVGFGVTAKGDVGVAKGSTTVIGHLQFARDVKKPVVYPRFAAEASDESPLLVIESRPEAGHLDFARKAGVEVRTLAALGASPEQAIYRVDRSRFRRGLEKAMRMGAFFAKPAQASSKRKWKVHTLKAGLDISVVGDLGFAALGGVAATDFGFYNQRF
jgi:hypothetical protein